MDVQRVHGLREALLRFFDQTGRDLRTIATETNAGLGTPAAGRPRSLLTLLVVAGAALAADAGAQLPPDTLDEGDAGFRLEQNYPNPFNPETRIPFQLSESLFADGEPVVVSIRIYNILQQFVAAPVALGFGEGAGLPTLQLEYRSPGRYEAYWDGRDRNGDQVASGVYIVQMLVNGRTAWRKMFVTK